MKNIDKLHLEKLQGWYHGFGILPTHQQICNILGFKSKNASFKLIQRLIEDGYFIKIGSRIAPTDKFFL